MIDIEFTVDKLDELGLLRKHKITGDYYTIYCPIHNNGQERRPSSGILLHDIYKNGRQYTAGTFHCFTCQAVKSLPDLVTYLLEQKHVSKSGFDWLKENIPGFESEDLEFDNLIPEGLVKSLEAKYAVNHIQGLLVKKKQTFVSEEELQSYRYTCEYMYRRGLTDEIINKYDIGVDLNFVPPGRRKPVPCITFPVRDSKGRTLFILRRSIENKFFFIPEDIEKPLYGLYELPKDCKSVDIVESCFNLHTCVKYGRPAVALLGTGTPLQIKQLRSLGVKEFRLGLDPDEAGRRGTKKLKKALSDVAIIWQYEGIPEGKDINDLSESEFNELNLI